jgi:hypothetical protein
MERQRQIEHFPGIDLLVQHEINQLREVAANGGWTTVQMHVR